MLQLLQWYVGLNYKKVPTDIGTALTTAIAALNSTDAKPEKLPEELRACKTEVIAPVFLDDDDTDALDDEDLYTNFKRIISLKPSAKAKMLTHITSIQEQIAARLKVPNLNATEINILQWQQKIVQQAIKLASPVDVQKIVNAQEEPKEFTGSKKPEQIAYRVIRQNILSQPDLDPAYIAKLQQQADKMPPDARAEFMETTIKADRDKSTQELKADWEFIKLLQPLLPENCKISRVKNGNGYRLMLADQEGSLTEFLQRPSEKISEEERKKYLAAAQAHTLKHSFEMVAGVPYAISYKVYLGKGGYGTVKIAETENGVDFARKVQITKHPDSATSTETLAMQQVGIQANEATRVSTSPKKRGQAKEHGSSTAPVITTLSELYLGANVMDIIYTGMLAAKEEIQSAVPTLLQLKTALACAFEINACHQQSIIHGDIKPENFMMHFVEAADQSVDVIVLPIDFGMATILKAGERATSQGKKGGTPGYIAPEACSDGKPISTATDVYSLGKMFHGNLQIDIPEMYAEDPTQRPSLDAVMGYLDYLMQPQGRATTEPFATWHSRVKTEAETKNVAAAQYLAAKELDSGTKQHQTLQYFYEKINKQRGSNYAPPSPPASTVQPSPAQSPPPTPPTPSTPSA